VRDFSSHSRDLFIGFHVDIDVGAHAIRLELNQLQLSPVVFA
jgi:hypothetical protein